MREAKSRKRKRPKHGKPQNQQKHVQSNDNRKHKNDNNTQIHEQVEPEQNPDPLTKRPKSSSCSFLDKMRARLSGGHFRMINEKLYTCTGEEALNYFKEDPSLFDRYHAGYQEQMSHWPEQPVNIITNWLKDCSPSLLVADFGCGDARLAKNVKNKVFSFDLVSNDPSVIACDMSNTDLDGSSVDVAVFCLSLMGTNYSSYLQEAHRVLKPSGWLLIAEVKSRFDPSTGGADPKKFSKAISDLGFTSMLKEKQSSKMKKIEWPGLKPCLYKRR